MVNLCAGRGLGEKNVGLLEAPGILISDEETGLRPQPINSGAFGRRRQVQAGGNRLRGRCAELDGVPYCRRITLPEVRTKNDVLANFFRENPDASPAEG